MYEYSWGLSSPTEAVTAYCEKKRDHRQYCRGLRDALTARGCCNYPLFLIRTRIQLSRVLIVQAPADGSLSPAVCLTPWQEQHVSPRPFSSNSFFHQEDKKLPFYATLPFLLEESEKQIMMDPAPKAQSSSVMLMQRLSFWFAPLREADTKIAQPPNLWSELRSWDSGINIIVFHRSMVMMNPSPSVPSGTCIFTLVALLSVAPRCAKVDEWTTGLQQPTLSPISVFHSRYLASFRSYIRSFVP